jgi:DNA helicase-2/ATP-dependent DNA helicase PcrA
MALDYDRHFLPAYDRAFPGRPRPNSDQRDAILHSGDALFLVAGPGSGKTTVLTLRILFKVLCGGVPPNAVLATTFTVKAAAELRSRILGWGFALKDQLVVDERATVADRELLQSVDINQVITGTLDSICKDVVSQNRAAAEQPPVVVDEFLANTVMLRSGLFAGSRYQDADLDAWLMQIGGSSGWGWNLGEKRKVLSAIWDRIQQDLTDVKTLAAKSSVLSKVKPALVAALSDYETELRKNNWLDFGMLERQVLQDLQTGKLDSWAKGFQELLVDEYQDTNLLHEQIYFELGRRSGAGLTVVGDDDQSLYRFRGAVVELFRDFSKRLKAALNRSADPPVFLAINYRSTDPIIDFSDLFVRRDVDFQPERVMGKPRIKSPGIVAGLPILGIFRPNLPSLAAAVADFIADVTSPIGRVLGTGDTLRIDLAKDGALGDLCVLMSSPAEFKRAAPARPGAAAPAPEPRFPVALRQELANRGMQVFNPRGSPLGEIDIVQQLGGLLLESLDDRGIVQATDRTRKRLGYDAQRLFPTWRNVGRAKQRSIFGLDAYVKTWQTRSAPTGYRWPISVAVLDLLYGLVHYLPEFHDDPEGQCFLEVFTRQLNAMSGLSGFEGRVVTNPANRDLSEASVRDLVCDWLAPIANGSVELDEDMIGSFPRDRLSILSIHQSKGLEFPLVFVDIGSDFKRNHPAHAFKRFPNAGSMSHTLEDLTRPLSGLAPPNRDGQRRAFDDLERMFYVAFTRAQQILVLFGLNGSNPMNATVQNVAAGWDRSGNTHGQNWKVIYL